MADVAAAVVAVALLGALALALLAAVTVVPFVVALGRAGARGLSPARAGALALVTSLLGPLVALLVVARTSLPWPVAALSLLLALAGPLVVAAAPSWLGRRGRHEPGAA